MASNNFSKPIDLVMYIDRGFAQYKSFPLESPYVGLQTSNKHNEQIF